MTITELRQTARDGDEFYGYSRQGRRWLCRWANVRRGLFDIVENPSGRPVRDGRCDMRGCPDMPTVPLTHATREAAEDGAGERGKV